MENYNFEVLQDDHIDINGTEINLHSVPPDKLETMRARYAKKAENENILETDGYYKAALEAIERVIQYRKDHPEVILTPMELLELARRKKVGDTVTCPQCKKEFKKANSQQAFCSNAKSKQGGNCKDRFWNLHNQKRKDRLDEIHEAQYT